LTFGRMNLKVSELGSEIYFGFPRKIVVSTQNTLIKWEFEWVSLSYHMFQVSPEVHVIESILWFART
jgi:hypothetical protein